ncbi:MAG: DUF3656 domain-containing protein [Clostridiales bacterium]|nr:DUF3656 domain-containing protein [Clostridiales bacterium]
MIDLVKSDMPELLAPAGRFESVVAAVNGGCDAVYVGGKAFSARSGADNFSDDELWRVMDYCHLRGVNVYIAVNTLVKESEFAELLPFIEKAFNEGADAFITQDLGQAAVIKDYLPKAILHASTQTAAYDAQSARFLAEMAGFARVTAAREASLKEITALARSVPAEIEVFVHGAVCVCFSGKCLMSAEFGGRSGNRGRCAQPCRQRYSVLKNGERLRDGFSLSAKDMMTLDILPEIVATGVSSLKIEGRMKSPEYVGLTTRLYREQLDRIRDGSPFVSSRDTDSLLQIFGRGGSFTEGYFKKRSGIDMISLKTPKSVGLRVGTVVKTNASGRCFIKAERETFPGDGVEIDAKTPAGAFLNRNCKPGERLFIDLPKTSGVRVGDKVFRTFDKKLNDELSGFYSRDTRKMTILCEVKARVGEPLEITLKNDFAAATLKGAVVSEALTRPMNGEILERVGKTGDYPFEFKFSNCDIGENVFISVGQINELKRAVVKRFSQNLTAFRKRADRLAYPPRLFHPEVNRVADSKINVQITDPSMFDSALAEGVNIIYVEASRMLPDMSAKAHENGSLLYAALPAYLDHARAEELVRECRGAGADGFLARTLGQLGTLKFLHKRLKGGTDFYEKKTAADYGMNIFNSRAKAFVLRYADTVCLSAELSFEEAAAIAGDKTEMIIHGRLPLMTTRQCPAGLYGGESGGLCAARESNDGYALLDRKGAVLPVSRDCDACIAHILSPRALFTMDMAKKLTAVNVGAFRVVLTSETNERAREIVRGYVKALEPGVSPETINEIAERMKALYDEGVTCGRLANGVF